MDHDQPHLKAQVWVFSPGSTGSSGSGGQEVLLLKTRPERGGGWQPITGSIEPGSHLGTERFGSFLKRPGSGWPLRTSWIRDMSSSLRAAGVGSRAKGCGPAVWRSRRNKRPTFAWIRASTRAFAGRICVKRKSCLSTQAQKKPYFWLKNASEKKFNLSQLTRLTLASILNITATSRETPQWWISGELRKRLPTVEAEVETQAVNR